MRRWDVFSKKKKHLWKNAHQNIDTRPIDACKRVRVQIETIGHNICDAFIYILFPARQMNVPFGSAKTHNGEWSVNFNAKTYTNCKWREEETK